MTRLLEQLIARASKLSAPEQDALATRWLEEIEDDAQWDAKFSSSQAELAKLAADVREQIQAGRVRSSGIDEL
jgi:hypothetical protein